MSKAIILLSLLLVSLNSYKLYDTVMELTHKPLKDIDWPFTICGEGSWTPESMKLSAKPARNTNDDITIVSYVLNIDWNS